MIVLCLQLMPKAASVKDHCLEFIMQEKMTESEKDKFRIWSKVGRDQEVWALNWERGGFRNLGAGSEMVPNGTNQVARYLDTIISTMSRYHNQHDASI